MSGGHHGPSSVEEMQEAEEIKAAEHLHERIKGFYLTAPFDAKIEGERLGIRHDLEHALEHEHHKKAQDVIVDVRVTEQLRKKVKKHKEEEKTAWRFVPGSPEWMKNRKKDFNNFTRVFKNPLRWFRDDYDEHAAEIEHEYGHASDVKLMRKALVNKLIRSLNNLEIDAIKHRLGLSPSSVLDVDLLANATPALLAEIGSTVFSTTTGKPILDENTNYQKLLELRQIEANEKAKVISVHIYDPDRLRKFSMDLGHPAETHDIPTILSAFASHCPVLSQFAVDIINTHLGKPLGSPFDVQDLALASSAALIDIYNNTTLALGGTPVFQGMPEFVELIQARKSIEDKERLYQLLKDTLGDHFYDHMHGDHRKLALLARIENEFFAGDREKLFVWLDEIKKDVVSNLVGPEAEKTEKEKANSLKVDEGFTQIKKTAAALMKKYREALTIPDKIVELDKELVKIRDAKVKAAAKGAVLSDQLESDVSRELRQTQQRKKDLPIEVQDLEQQYKDEGNDFILFLKNDLKVKSLEVRLTELESATKLTATDLSDANSIFDKTKFSKMEKFVQAFVSDRKFSNEIQDEIKKVKSPTQRPPLSADHLLFELNVRSAKEKFPDDTRAWKIARMATSFEQIDAKNVELFRAGNREIAQGKVKGWKGLAGVWRKSKQQIASGFFNSDTFKGRDIIEHIAGLDHAFECFKDLPVDASLADIRNAIKHHGGISNENLMKFYMHLQEALKSFTVGHHRKVEIMDRDWPIEQVALFAEKIHAELEAREFVHKIEHPDTPEDKQLKLSNKAAYFQKLLNQREESQKKLEAAHLEQMRRPDSDWQVSWIKSLMKGKYGEAYQQALAKGKEQGLSGKALRDFVSSEGSIPKTVLKHLMTGLALKEAYDITSKSTKWIGSKLFNASKKAASVGVEKGGGLLSAAWRNLGKPAAGATGRGLKAVGRGALRVGKFALWDVWKFSFWTAPKWTAQKAWNVTTWPFRMVGRGAKGFWNFFHYTEEKRARDAAWYAAKKAAAGHGGGGHGGGH